MKKIFLSQPDLGRLEKSAVLRVLNTSSLALGPKLTEFEDKFARYIGTKYAVAVSSGTAGLHLLIRSLNIGPGDEVITTPFSFIASANCILFEKARPVFVDIDPITLNIDPKKIIKAITRRTKAILVVDVFGCPADWDKILAIARKHKLLVIEDSCEAIGAKYFSQKQKKWFQCGQFGQAAVFAFYPNKQITTGEGGMIVTNNKKIADLCRSMANQGRDIKNGQWLAHFRLGYNYRMSDINAALGTVQLSRINEIIKKRDQVAKIYQRYLSKTSDFILPTFSSSTKVSWFVYVIRLSKRYSRQDRDKILQKLRQVGIQCSNYFQCIHLQPFYQKEFNYKRGMFPIAEFISDRTIALPFYNNLSEKNIRHVVQQLKQCLALKP